MLEVSGVQALVATDLPVAQKLQDGLPDADLSRQRILSMPLLSGYI